VLPEKRLLERLQNVKTLVFVLQDSNDLPAVISLP
jgi:hypothetical protein